MPKLVFMEEQIAKIEKESGKKIDIEKEVGICYFLLHLAILQDQFWELPDYRPLL